jgi:hypothetical protein
MLLDDLRYVERMPPYVPVSLTLHSNVLKCKIEVHKISESSLQSKCSSRAVQP